MPPPKQVPTLGEIDNYAGFVFSTPVGEAMIVSAGSVSLTKYLAPFTGITGFTETYGDYLYNPDTGVVAVPDPLDAPANPPQDRLVAEANRLPQNMRTSLAFLYALVSLKTMGNANQYNQVMRRRVEALQYVLADDYLNLITIKAILTRETCEKIAKKLSFYPKLKAMVCNLLMSQGGQIRIHANLIIKESQMSLFGVIFKFLMGDVKTAAHLEPSVLADTRKFLAVYEALRLRYGESWSLYKVLEPTGTMVQNANWPKLAEASMAFAITYDSTNYARMAQAGNISARMFTLVSQRISPRYVFQEQRHTLTPEECGMILEAVGIQHDLHLHRHELEALQIVVRDAELENRVLEDCARIRRDLAVVDPQKNNNNNNNNGHFIITFFFSSSSCSGRTQMHDAFQ